MEVAMIRVCISDANEVKTMLSKTRQTRQIKLDEGSFQCCRRYSDFDTIRSVMVQNWPGCFVPPLPPKKFMGNNDTSFIQGRRKGLEQFCSKLADKSYLWYSQEFQLFIRTPGEFEKIGKSLPVQVPQQLLQKFSKFQGIQGKEIDTILIAKITEFHSFLKNANQQLKEFREQTQQMVTVVNANNDLTSVILNFWLPELEIVCEGNTPISIFSQAGDHKLAQLINDLKQTYEDPSLINFISEIEMEQQDFEAFTESMNLRENYQQRLSALRSKLQNLEDQQVKNAGSKSKGFFKSNPQVNSQLIERNLKMVSQQIQMYRTLCDLITLISGHIEIQNFKKIQVERFNKSLGRLATFKFRQSQIKYNIYDHLLLKSQ